MEENEYGDERGIYLQCVFSPTHNEGSIMVRAVISLAAPTTLVFITGCSLTARHIEEVSYHVVPFALFIATDNTRPHATRCISWQKLDSPKLNWPACFLDANPVEHVWGMLGTHVRHRAIAPVTIKELHCPSRRIGEYFVSSLLVWHTAYKQWLGLEEAIRNTVYSSLCCCLLCTTFFFYSRGNVKSKL